MLQGWVGEVAVCDVNLHCLDPELWMIIWYCPCLVLGCILFLLLFPECVPPRHSNKIISSKPTSSRFCSAECVRVGVGWMPEENGFPYNARRASALQLLLLAIFCYTMLQTYFYCIHERNGFPSVRQALLFCSQLCRIHLHPAITGHSFISSQQMFCFLRSTKSEMEVLVFHECPKQLGAKQFAS